MKRNVLPAIRHTARWPCALLLIGSAVLGGCTTAKIPLTGLRIPVPDIRLPFFGKNDLDYSKMSWAEAFETVHAKLSTEYPFTQHKNIDWAALQAQIAPRIAAAQENNDEDAYYLALLDYVYAVPDGNMGLYKDESIRKKHIGGGFGLGVIQLDDGRVIAHILMDATPASEAGMQWGAEILTWNGTPIQELLATTPVIWAGRPPATAEGRKIEQLRFLTRAPIGTEASISFKNPGAVEPANATIIAYNDGYATLERSYLYNEEIGDFDTPIRAKVLPSGFGYIKICFQSPTVVTPFPADAFRGELDKLIRKGVPGLILDLRGNSGGANELVPRFVSHFFKEETFYEDVAVFDAESGQFALKKEASLRVKPREPYFDGPVTVLVAYSTFNSGEGIAMAMQKRPGTHVVGCCGTHGSFGLGGGYIDLPNGLAVYFPIGRSLNAEGVIQIEGDVQGIGGVQPDVRVPLNEDTVRRIYADEADVILERAEELLRSTAWRSKPETLPGTN